MKKQAAVLVLTLVTAWSLAAFATEGSGRDKGRQQGPPPEAYTACEGKSSGDRAEFTSPRGDTVSGTCEKNGDRLVLRPDRPPGEKGRKGGDTGSAENRRNGGNGGGRQQGPPPEAYTACEGKSSGDRAEFTGPRGDTVSGTCEKNGDRLVLRPDRRPEQSRGGGSGKGR